MFGANTDKKQWQSDQALVASKDEAIAEMRKLSGERAKIEERVKAGELTRAAYTAVDDKLGAVRKKLQTIQRLEVEMPGRCPDKKLVQQMKALRRRQQDALRDQTKLGNASEEAAQRRNVLQRQFDESGETWPPDQRRRFQDDLEHAKADADYAAEQLQKQRQLCADLEAEREQLKQKMIKAKA